MTGLRLLTVAVVLGVLAPTALADDATPLRNWVSPIYWSPAALSPENAGATERMPLSARETLASSAPLPFVAITPCRIADTRNGAYPSGYGPPQLVGGGAARTFVIPSGPCPGIPTTAGAFSLNFTIVAPGGTPPGGYLSVWPAGSPQPVVSTLNYTSGSILANAAIVPAGTGGGINLFVNFSTDLIIDINGYYSGTGLVTSVTPGTGLSGGGTGDVVLGIAPNGVTSTELAANAVTSSKIAANAVTAGAIASNAAVKSLNAATGDLTIVGSGSVTVGTAGSTLTIGAPSGSYVLGAPGDTTLIGAGYTEVGASSIEFWSATKSSTAPAARYLQAAVWTGTEMIVWGGYSGTYHHSGGRYNPATDTWSSTSTATNCPAARYVHTAVWTGTEMIVWGGTDGVTAFNTGGRYNPVSNAWTATNAAFAPTGRYAHTAVWTGSTMIVWGGFTGSLTNTGGIYSPATNGWTDTSVGTNVPTPRFNHEAVWASGISPPVMIVWGGFDSVAPRPSTGGRYNPATNTWATMAAGPSGREYPSAVWTGTRMIVWGGYDGSNAVATGGQYNPVGNSWTATATVGAPSGRYLHTAVWTGVKMIVWGGWDGATTLSSGGVYSPAGNDWASTSGVAAPSARRYHTAVWTGSRMIVWGGVGADNENTGGAYQFLSVFKKD